MTYHSKSNYYYNNENDALSCNSRPISSTLRRESSNNQYKNHIDIYDSYGNTDTYDNTNGSSGRIDVIMQQQSYAKGSDVITASMTVGTEYGALHGGNGYVINDNVNYQSQAYLSYTTDAGGGIGFSNDGYSYSTSPSSYRNSYDSATTIGNTGEGRYSTLGTTKTLPRLPIKANSSIMDGMYAYMGAMKIQPQRDDARQPLTTPSALQLQAAVAARTPQCRLHAQMHALSAGYDALLLNEFDKRNAGAATCTTDRSRCDVVGLNEQHCSGAASLRLLPKLHSHQSPHGNVIKRQLFEGGNAGALTKTPTATSTMLEDKDYNTYNNATIRKNYCNNYDDKCDGSVRSEMLSYYTGSDDSKTSYYATTVQRPHTSMAPFDYREFEDHSSSYKNVYNSNADNLSTCSDTPAYTASQAQKLQLQQERKFAIMMAMTTASVIASGETRLPVKRIAERTATTLADRMNVPPTTITTTEMAGTVVKGFEDYDYIGIETRLWERKHENMYSNKATSNLFETRIAPNESNSQFIADKAATIAARPTAVSLTDSTAITSSRALTAAAATTATTTTSAATMSNGVAPTSALGPPTTARKLPKRLPTPNFNSEKNGSRRKENGLSKKLPKLPIDMNKPDNSSATIKSTATASDVNTKVMSAPKKATTASITTAATTALTSPTPETATIAIATNKAVESLSTSYAITNSALPSLTLDTFSESKSLAYITSTSTSSPTSVSAFPSTYGASHSPSYLSYLSNAVTTTTTTLASAAVKAQKNSEYFSPSESHPCMLSEQRVGDTKATTAAATTLTAAVSSIGKLLYISETIGADSNLVTTTAAKTGTTYSADYSENSSLLSVYNNNLNDETSFSSNVNHLNNNNLITSVSTRMSISSPVRKPPIKTIEPIYSDSLAAYDLPSCLKYQTTTSSSSSSSTGTSISVNSYTSSLQTTSLSSLPSTLASTSTSSPSSSPSISMPSYTCTVLPVTDHGRKSVITTTETAATAITTFIPSEKSSIIYNTKFSDSCRDSIGDIMEINTAYRTSSTNTHTSSSMIGGTTSKASIYDEYLKGDGISYHSFIPLPSTETIITATSTSTSASTVEPIKATAITIDNSPPLQTDLPSLSSLMSLKPSTVVTTSCVSLASPIFTSKELDKDPSSYSPIDVLSKLVTTKEIEKGTSEFAIESSTSTTNYFENYPLNLITATPSVDDTSDNKDGQLLTTAIEVAKETVTTTAIAATVTTAKVVTAVTSPANISFTDTTTPTSNADYLTKYELPKTTYSSQYISNASDDSTSCIANGIESELPAYITDFLNCDTSKSKISGTLGNYDTSSFNYKYNSFDLYTKPIKFISTSTCTTTSPTTTIVEVDIANATSTIEVRSANEGTTLPTVTATATATEKEIATTSSFAGVDVNVLTSVTMTTAADVRHSAEFSMPYVDRVDVTATTTSGCTAPSLTSQSLASAFDDNFYDSYNVDWADLTAPAAHKAELSALTTATTVMANNEPTVTTSALLSSMFEATTATTTITSSISVGGGSLQGGYYRPASVATNTYTTTRKSLGSLTTATSSTTAAGGLTTTSAAMGVAGKATSMFGDISKGLKGGLDGVFSGVNTATATATADANAKQQTQQQPAKKSGFGFSLTSKFVPNVGGLLAGATAAVQQTSVVKSSKNSDPVISKASTISTAAATKFSDVGDTMAGITTTTIITTASSSNNLFTANVTVEDGTSSNSSYGVYSNSTIVTFDETFQQTAGSNLNQYSDLLYTNSTPHVSGNAVYGQQIHIQSDDVMLNAMYIMHDSSVGSGDDIMYVQQQPHSSAVVVTSDSTKVGFNGHSYDECYDAGNVMDLNVAVDDEYGYTEYEYAADLKAGDDIYNVTYAEQIADGMHIIGADGSIVTTTAALNDYMMATFYHPQQQAVNEQLPNQQQQATKLSSTASLAKKATSSLLPSLTNFAAQVQTQRPPANDNSNAETPVQPSSSSATAAKPAGGGGGAAGGMFGSFLGKAAAAVQSATQVVNQATTVVQQKTAIPATKSATAAVTTSSVVNSAKTTDTITAASAATATNGYSLMHNNDYNIHQQQEQQKLLSHQNSMSSQYSATTAIGDDYENRNVYHYNDNAAASGTETTATNYYLNGNQSQLQQQSGKLLPTVPPAGSTGKKLPTINTSKSGFLIKQQPTEIYDNDLIVDDVNDANGHQLIGIDDEHDELLDDEIVDEMNENELDIVDDGELDRYIVDDRIGSEHCHKQQRLRQIQPNYDIDSEQTDYYMDLQLQTTPSDVQQQKLSQHHQRRLAANSYYEHTNGGYDYREDYFNEEDEYKYLEKEQELLYQEQQQQSQKLLKQKQHQHSYQLDDSSDAYLEESYQSEDSGNYLDESSSGSVVGAAASAKAKTQAIEHAEQQVITENVVSNGLHPSRSSAAVIAVDSATAVVNGSAQHQHQIKKQDSIIMEEDDDDILLSEVGVSTSGLSKVQQSSHSRRPSHDSLIENEDDTMSELPSLSATTKKRVLMRGETEEVVGGHMHMLRKPEVTAKQRWHWAYNKIIMQLNRLVGRIQSSGR